MGRCQDGLRVLRCEVSGLLGRQGGVKARFGGLGVEHFGGGLRGGPDEKQSGLANNPVTEQRKMRA